MRVLRQMRRDLGTSGGRSRVDEALDRALEAVKRLDIPHLELEYEEDQIVH